MDKDKCVYFLMSYECCGCNGFPKGRCRIEDTIVVCSQSVNGFLLFCMQFSLKRNRNGMTVIGLVGNRKTDIILVKKRNNGIFTTTRHQQVIVSKLKTGNNARNGKG